MKIRVITTSDIPIWEALASEYDCYVQELVGNLTEWYEGNDDSMAFIPYMKAKISKQEAFMVVDSNSRCLGIVAFSKHNNRITFFGVYHDTNFSEVGNALLFHAFKHLDASRDIYINEIASPSAWIEQHRMLLSSVGFAHIDDSLENGVPVNVYLKSPDIL